MTAKATDSRFDLLYRKYGRVIYARCRRMLGDQSSAEDATQEIYLRVAIHLHRAPSSMEALFWIYRITTNYCLNELRSVRRHPGSAVADLDPSDQQGEDWLVNRDLVRKVLARVPEHLRVPVWLYHVDGMSHDEVARVLGISRRTVINYIAAFHERTGKFLRRVS